MTRIGGFETKLEDQKNKIVAYWGWRFK